MSPCLLCNDETGECLQESKGHGLGVTNADVVLYVSSLKSGNEIVIIISKCKVKNSTFICAAIRKKNLDKVVSQNL